MRISDWSSDVCSSDLRLERPPTHLAADAERDLAAVDRLHHPCDKAHHGRREPVIALGEPGVRAVGGEEELGQVVGADRQELEKIGRELCRERVCKYV